MSQGVPLVRGALAADVTAIRELLQPAVARGEVLPREVLAEDFQVAELDGVVVGAVALTRWTDRVVELGSLVAGVRGRGIGGLLVEGAAVRARAKGFKSIVALTSLDDWFVRNGFGAEEIEPWLLARAAPVLVPSFASGDALLDAVVAKARMSCAGCARLGSCRQTLMRRDLPAVMTRRRQVA